MMRGNTPLTALPEGDARTLRSKRAEVPLRLLSETLDGLMKLNGFDIAARRAWTTKGRAVVYCVDVHGGKWLDEHERACLAFSNLHNKNMGTLRFYSGVTGPKWGVVLREQAKSVRLTEKDDWRGSFERQVNLFSFLQEEFAHEAACLRECLLTKEQALLTMWDCVRQPGARWKRGNISIAKLWRTLSEFTRGNGRSAWDLARRYGEQCWKRPSDWDAMSMRNVCERLAREARRRVNDDKEHGAGRQALPHYDW